MTLGEIREKFVDLSGRLDLVTSTQDYEDDGADFFIKGGQQFLDNRLGFPHKDARIEVSVEEGQDMILLAGIQSLGRILRHTDEGAVPLKEFRHERFFDLYGNQDESGKPAYFTASSAAGGLKANEPGGGNKSEVQFYPIADGQYMFSVFGSFFSAPLEEDDDENFWSTAYPMALIQAAMYSLERFYRNRQGMNDHLAAIQRDLQGIDFNVAEDESSEVDQMNNSW